MSDEDKTDFGLEAIREKLKNSRGDAVVSGAAPEQDKGLKVRDDFLMLRSNQQRNLWAAAHLPSLFPNRPAMTAKSAGLPFRGSLC